MRVCFITGEYPPMTGGVGDYTRIMAHTLAQMGLQTAVLTISRVRAFWDQAPAAVSVYPIIRHWGFTSWPAIGRALRRLDPDILHLQYQTAAYAMHPAVNLLPWWLRRSFPELITVTTFHDLREPHPFPASGKLGVAKWLNRFLLRQSHAAILTNAEDAHRVQQWGIDLTGPHASGVVRLIPIGANVLPQATTDYQRQRWRQRFSPCTDGFLISYFGLINQSKGFDTLLRALRRLIDGGLPVLLVVVGGEAGESDPTNQVYRQQVLQLAQELGVARYLRWTGFLPDDHASACLKASDVCVLPYRDGASYRRGGLMAALVHGLPIVSTQKRENPEPPLPEQLSAGGGVPELVSGRNCLLVPPDDPVALAGAVQQVLSQPELARRLGEGALELSQAFSWQSIAEKHVALYGELLRRGARRVGGP